MPLFVTSTNAGSAQIRGMQIAAALGMQVCSYADSYRIATTDCVVAVKRVPGPLVTNLREARRPWAWDVLDAYPQPVCSRWSRAEAIAWMQGELSRLRPTAVIWPNKRMQADIPFAGPSIVIPHHCRPNLARNPIRERIAAIGYEGAAEYLGEWAAPLERAAARIGARFVVNPAKLADLDIVVAVRGADHNGYAQRHWKSNVKLANAHGSGTPFIGARECGYLETASGYEYWADSPDEIGTALAWMADQGTRAKVSAEFLSRAYSLQEAAEAYYPFLEMLGEMRP